MKKHPIGDTIKNFRLKHCWTQAQAAQKLGIGLRTLISFENGEERRPRPLTIAKINMAIASIEKAA